MSWDIGAYEFVPVGTLLVWPIPIFIPLTIGKSMETVMVSFGDGYEQRGIKSQAYTHADGKGGVTSHRGRWQFEISLTAISQANANPAAEVNKLWDFYTAVNGNVNAFYFYNPIEAPVIDLSGASTTGRYLVRFRDNIASLEAFMLQVHRGKLALIEVQS